MADGDREMLVLKRFAEYAIPGSRFEVLGTPVPGEEQLKAVEALLRAGYLERAATEDAFGAPRYRLTATGRTRAGKKTSAGMAGVPSALADRRKR